MTVLFALAYWCVVFVAAVGGVILATFIWFGLSDLLRERRQFRRASKRFDRLTVAISRPFDQNDPLERLGALPCAPDPTWLV